MTTAHESPFPSGKAARIAIWVLQALAAAAFIAAGGAKLASVPQMVDIFQHIGVGQWFRYVTGAIEVVAGIALLFRSAAVFGALALVVTMIGAVITHLFVIGGNPAPAFVLLTITAIIAWFRRGQIIARP